MKKIFAILIIASCIISCNNSSKETTTTKDSVSSESPLMDAVNTADSAKKIIHDSTAKMPDSMMKK